MTQVWSATQINGNLSGGGTTTVTDVSGGSTYSSAYGSEGVTSGKYYWEATTSTLAGFNETVGIGSTGSSSANGVFVGGTLDTLGVFFSGTSAYIYVGGSNYVVVTVAAANNDIIGFALDLTNNSFWFKSVTQSSGWFGSASGGDPATNTNGFSLTQATFTIINNPVVPALTLSTNGATGTGYFAQPSWTGAAPSGFGPFDPTVRIPLSLVLASGTSQTVTRTVG